MRTGTARVAVVLVVTSLAACSSTSSTADESTRDSSGQVVDGGDVGVFALRVGDCVDASAFLDTGADGDLTEVDTFAALPCDQPHTGEVVFVDEEFFADLDEFPTSDDLYNSGSPACMEALDEYTGTVYESSPFQFAPLIPSEDSWDEIDDRGLVCIGIIQKDDQDELVETTESMKA